MGGSGRAIAHLETYSLAQAAWPPRTLGQDSRATFIDSSSSAARCYAPARPPGAARRRSTAEAELSETSPEKETAPERSRAGRWGRIDDPLWPRCRHQGNKPQEPIVLASDNCGAAWRCRLRVWANDARPISTKRQQKLENNALDLSDADADGTRVISRGGLSLR